MGFRAAGDPVEHEVRSRHLNDIAGVGVERVLTWSERAFPDATLSLGDALAVAKSIAGHIPAYPADVADDNADVADLHDGLGNHLDGGEPAVDEVGAVRQRDILPAAPAARSQKRLGILV